MPSYKLTYFDVRGLGEPARFLFLLAGVPFEDERITQGNGDWEKIKDSTPFGQIPVLTVDGRPIPQSAAIFRYLAKKFGFAGKTDEEQAWVDAVVDQFKDLAVAFRPYVLAIRYGKPEEEIERVKQEIFLPARRNYFKILNELLEKSESGWIVGNGLTFADLAVVENLTTLEKNGVFDASEEPKLEELRRKVYSLEKLKDYIANRRDTQF